MQLRLQISPAVDVQHRTVGRGGSVERQQSPGRLVVAGVLSRRDDHFGHHRETGSAGQSLAHRRHGRLAQEPGRGERHHQQTVGHLGGRAGQPRAQRAEVDRRRPERVGAGVERRGHQGVPVELAAEVQPLTGLPGGEDRPQRADEFTHAGHRMVEGRPVALLDLGADLGAQPQGEPAPGEQLVVVGLVRQLNRVARERDRDVGHQVQAGHPGSQRERREHVVRSLEGEYPGRAGRLEGLGPLDRVSRPEQGGVHPHASQP